MANYTCPLCHKTMNRDLVVYLDHTNGHVIDKIKEAHPEWVEDNGACQPCAEYFRAQLSGEPGNSNIGPNERSKRVILGWISLAVGLIAGILMLRFEMPFAVRGLLFLPFFLAALGFIQAKEKTCALLSFRGQKNMDKGVAFLENGEASVSLRRKGAKILFMASIVAVIITFIFCLV